MKRPDVAAPNTIHDKSELDEALEASSAIMRTLGQHAFAVDGDEPVSIARRFERWASHLLVLSSVDDDSENAKDASATKGRRWRDLVRFVTEHRRREKAHVDKTTTGLREALWAVMGVLAKASSEDNAREGGLRTQLDALRKSVATGTPDDLRRDASTLATMVTQVLDDNVKRREVQAKLLHERLKQVEVELQDARRESSTDPLTKLSNRRVFDAAMKHAVDVFALTMRPASVVFIDVDHFKSVNDRFGHAVGDEVLRRIADCAARSFPRRTDVVARYGGEEIACVLPDTGLKDACMLAERLRRAVRNLEIDIGGEFIAVTVSAGVAEAIPGESTTDVVTRADRALYEAKRGGRDRVVSCDGESGELRSLVSAPKLRSA